MKDESAQQDSAFCMETGSGQVANWEEPKEKECRVRCSLCLTQQEDTLHIFFHCRCCLCGGNVYLGYKSNLFSQQIQHIISYNIHTVICLG